MAKSKQQSPKEGQREVFCRFIVRKGKKIYPKNAKFFHFFVDDRKKGA